MVYNICVILLYFSEIVKLLNNYIFFFIYIKINFVNIWVVISIILLILVLIIIIIVLMMLYIICGKFILFIYSFFLISIGIYKLEYVMNEFDVLFINDFGRYI